MLLVKKYPNRRLYDTKSSRYVTLDDLAGIIRKGEDVSVQDAQTNQDLTQEVLMQIILERGGGKLLPAALLLRLIRLDDAALGEFMTRYVSWALDMYLQAKERTSSFFNRNPLANAPFAAADAIARFALDNSPYGRMMRRQERPPQYVAPPHAGPPPPDPDAYQVIPEPDFYDPPGPAEVDVNVRMQQIQEQLEALKSQLGAAQPAATPKKKAKSAKKRAP